MKGILLSIAIVAIIVVMPSLAVFSVTESMPLALAVTIIPIFISVRLIFLPRIRMERRAKELLTKMPEHDNKTIYLNFASCLPNAKRAAMELKIAEVERDGWTFLKASEAGLHRASFSWGGGLNLHFIREVPKSPATIA